MLAGYPVTSRAMVGFADAETDGRIVKPTPGRSPVGFRLFSAASLSPRRHLPIHAPALPCELSLIYPLRGEETLMATGGASSLLPDTIGVEKCSSGGGGDWIG